jgi:membrane-associated phospholipid phosphatase
MARDDSQRGGAKLPQAAEAALDSDAAAAAAMAPYRDLPWLEPIADLGDQPQLRTLSLALLAAGLAAGRRSGYGPRLARAGLRMLIAHEAATLAKDFVKRRIDRTRPRSLQRPGKDHRPSAGRSRRKEETSFPSGHSAGAAAAARAFARELPEYRAAAAAGAGTLALVQVPRCAHYPTDIAAGLAIGLAAEAAVAALWPAPALPAHAPATDELELPTCGYC